MGHATVAETSAGRNCAKSRAPTHSRFPAPLARRAEIEPGRNREGESGEAPLGRDRDCVGLCVIPGRAERVPRGEKLIGQFHRGLLMQRQILAAEQTIAITADYCISALTVGIRERSLGAVVSGIRFVCLLCG